METEGYIDPIDLRPFARADPSIHAGCPGQSYSCDDSREVRGPAILVYYAPALMQKAGRKNPYGALRLLG